MARFGETNPTQRYDLPGVGVGAASGSGQTNQTGMSSGAGVGSMEEILGGFGTAQERAQERALSIEDAYRQAIEGGREDLQAVAQGAFNQIFGPGGQAEQATNRALRATTESGFGPRSGGFDQARLNIQERGQDAVANQIARAAPQIRGQTLRSFGQLAGQARGTAEDLRQSMFTGRANIEQLRLAEEQMRQNERIINDRLGGGGLLGGLGDALGGVGAGMLAGAGQGSVLGVPGAAAGGILGGLTGLLG